MKIIRPFTVVPAGLTSNVAEADYPAHSLSTIYALGTRVISNHRIYESLTGKSGVVTISNATPAVVAWVGHGQAVNTPVSFATTGALPSPLVAGTVYYIIAAGLTADAFQLSLTLGGVAINTTTAGSGVHTATASTNYNKAPAANPTVWLDSGATNRWKMFDQSVQSQTSNVASIDVDIALTALIDSVALINISATSVQVVLTDAIEGIVYNETVDTVSTAGVYDMYTFFFEPISRTSEIIFTNIPPYLNAVLSVTLTDISGGTVLCGECIAGQALQIGDTEVGVKVGITDYSIKQRDAFGNFIIVERAFSRRANFTVVVESNIVDQLVAIFEQYRATPIVYVGTASYGSTLVYGFYKSFDIDIGYADGTSVCSLDIEGLV